MRYLCQRHTFGIGELNPDENKVITLVNELGKLKTQLSLIRIKRRIELKKVLASEQQERLKLLMKKKRLKP